MSKKDIVFPDWGQTRINPPVFGFMRKDSTFSPWAKGLHHYTVRKHELVPVVSLEWLKRWCNDNKAMGDYVDSFKLFSVAKKEAMRNYVDSFKLLSEAKKEAEKKWVKIHYD